jgi:hypothetical protein
LLIRLTYPSEAISAETIARALEASASVAESQLDKVPSIYDAIDSGRVVWRPEPAGQGFESFDTPLQVWRRGWGDCDDLVPWLLAELRTSGEDPEASAAAYQSGEKKWHCVVQRSDGGIDDPSRWAGMGSRSQYRVPAERPLMGRPDVAGMCVGEAAPNVYVCRFDLACEPGDAAGLSVRRSAGSPVEAVENAAKSSFHVAMQAELDPKIQKQLWGLVAALRGYGADYIARKTGLEPHEQGRLTPLVLRALDVADEYDVDGDGILSTIFDPFGLHHLADPFIQPMLDKAKNVTVAPRGGGPGINLQSLLSSIIGAKSKCFYGQRPDGSCKPPPLGPRGGSPGHGHAGWKGKPHDASSSSRGGGDTPRVRQVTDPSQRGGDTADAWAQAARTRQLVQQTAAAARAAAYDDGDGASDYDDGGDYGPSFYDDEDD